MSSLLPSNSTALHLHPAGGQLTVPHTRLATWFGVSPGRLTEVTHALPADFCFVVESETAAGGVRVFTEHGVLLAGCLLGTPATMAKAVELTRACVALRRYNHRPPAPRWRAAAPTDETRSGRPPLKS